MTTGAAIRQVVITEFAKLRHSRMPAATLAGLSLGPLGLAFFMWILRSPERARQLGLLGAKANLSGLEATWPAYGSALTLIVGISGMLLLPFIVAYVFGREYVDATAKNMLTLPIGRPWFAWGKHVVVLAWWATLTVLVLAEAVAVGLLLGLPGGSVELVAATVGHALVAAGVSALLAPVVAWVTTAARGLLAPVGFALAMLAVGNLLGHTGWAQWFPWSIVPSLIGMVDNPVDSLPVGSYLVLLGACVAGAVATGLQLGRADLAQ